MPKEITLTIGSIYSMKGKKYQVQIEPGFEEDVEVVSSSESYEEALKEATRWLKQNGHLDDTDLYPDMDLEPADFSGATEGDR